jgi:ketosteroid isomerase-like protein
MRGASLTIITLFAGATALASGSALARDKAQDERDIRAADAAVCHAFEAGDAGELKKYLEPTFTLTNSRGEVTDYQANLAEVASREPRYEIFRNHEQKVRVYGDAAVVTGVTSVKGTAEKKPFEADFQFTDTYVLHDARWLLAASHASRLATPAKPGDKNADKK